MSPCGPHNQLRLARCSAIGPSLRCQTRSNAGSAKPSSGPLTIGPGLSELCEKLPPAAVVGDVVGVSKNCDVGWVTGVVVPLGNLGVGAIDGPAGERPHSWFGMHS